MELTERLALTRVEAAELVGVHVNEISRAIHSGALRAHKVGRRYRIGMDDLREWFDQLPPA